MRNTTAGNVRTIGWLVFIIAIIGSIIGGVILISNDNTVLGIAIMFGGPLLWSIPCGVLWGIAEIADKLEGIEYRLYQNNNK